MEDQHQKTLFRDINADDDDPEVTEIESLCMNCHEQGTTRLFLTKIPYFREVIVSSFSCEHCNVSESELQPAGRIQEKGVKYNISVNNERDLNRQVVLTNTATVSIPEVEFETPPNKGVLTTIEGIIDRAVQGLSQDQVLRRIQHPEVAEQIDKFILKLTDLKTCKTSFHLVMDDPTGNSFVENPHAPKEDHDAVVSLYTRTREQNEVLCIAEEEESSSEAPIFDGKDEVMSFPTNCPNCNAPCPTNMKMVEIPHFKEVVIMATNCDACGLRVNEVKSGSGIEPQGRKITLKLTDVSDLSRDVLKSEMCCVSIPELEFTTAMSSMPGKFTTVEGLLDDISTQIKKFNPFLFGDSSGEDKTKKIDEFCDRINKIKNGEDMNVHVVLDDATGNSYLQNLYAPDPDPEMTIENYDRTFEQNEDLGVNDMKTENYEQS